MTPIASSSGKLTVICPIGNMAGRLENLKSWLRDALELKIEVILILDIKEPNTEIELSKICSEFKTPALKVIKGKYGGPGAARNEGLKFIRNQWIAFWDSDDIPNPSAFLRMIDFAERANLEICLGEFEILDENLISGAILKTLPESISGALKSVSLNPGIWRFIFKREIVENQLFRNFLMAEDQLFLAQINLADRNLGFYNNTVYQYYIGSNLQLTKNKQAISDISKTLNETFIILQKNSKRGASFTTRLIARQFITGLKRGDFRTKLQSLLVMLRNLLNCKILNFFLILRAMFEILFQQLQDSKMISSENEVIICLTGGLGNQFFQLANGLEVAQGRKLLIEWDIGKPRLNESGLPEIASYQLPKGVELLDRKRAIWIVHKAIGYMLRTGVDPKSIEKISLYNLVTRTISSLLLSIHLRKNIVIKVGRGVGFSSVTKSRRTIFLVGYFQTYRNICKDRVKEVFSNMQLVETEQEVLYYQHLAIIEKPLVLHVRLSDYKSEKDFGIPSSNYFEKSVAKLKETEEFNSIWIFSDEADLARSLLPESITTSARWIPQLCGSASATLEVMRLGRGFVIANSSYSWWGAMLCKSNPVMVIAPKPWFQNIKEPTDLIPNHWQRIEAW